MFFTREDIEKIHQGLLRLGIKDSELPETINVNSDDTLAVVQDGKNKKINIEEFFNNISLFKKEGFINITDRFNKHSISLIEAIQTVPTHQRIDGLVITFEDINGDWRIYQFRGDAVDFFDENKWTDLYDYTNYIVKSITPDEEDLTVSKPDKNGNAIVSLKDRVYDESNFSGKGYKILRKNIQTIDRVRKNILTQDMINKPNTIYEIRYDFDLNGKEITIPEGCILDFQGGSLTNGIIKGNNTIINAGNFKIFNTDVDFYGTWNIAYFNVLWMGAVGDEVFDNTEIFNKIFNTFNNIYIPKGRYVTNSIIIEKTLTSFHFYGNSNYSNASGNNDTAFIYTGTDYFLKLNQPCYSGIIEKFTIILGPSAKGGIYYNNIYHTITRFIGIDNNTSSIHTQACGFTIAGNGYSNLLNNIQCRYLHKGIEIISTGDNNNWLNNIQIGLSKGDVYINRGHYGIELQKGAGVILKGVTIENMENDAIVINDVGSLNTMNVFYSNGYIEDIKGSTFNITPRNVRNGGVNLFVDSVEFHSIATDNFCVNNGTNTCFVKIQNCIGIAFTGSEYRMFKGNLLLDLINKSINSSENIHYFNSSIPLHESYVSGSKYISALATKAFTLGSANSDVYGSYNLSKTSILVKCVLLRTIWNEMRKGLKGDLFYPLALSKEPAYGDNYIYKARLYLYRLTDDELSNSRVDYNSENMCCVDIFNNGEIQKIFGGDIFDLYNFKIFKLAKIEGKTPATRHVALYINNHISNSTPELDYSLGIVAEIECIGTPYLNNTIVNYGRENIRQLRYDLWNGYDTIFDTITNKWLYKDAGTMNWKDIEGNVLY